MNKPRSVAPPTPASKPPQGLVAFVRRLMFGQFRLKRGRDKHLHVTWGETLFVRPEEVAAKASTATSGAQPAKAVDPLSKVRAQLAVALDSKPTNRRAFGHLVFFETAFAKAGRKAFDELPVTALIKAHDQLELLVSLVKADDELQQLATDMSDAIARRSGRQVSLLVPSNLGMTSSLEMSEAGMSDFFDAAGDAPGTAKA